MANPTRSKVRQEAFEGGPPELPGRPLEVVGNGDPREMTVAFGPRSEGTEPGLQAHSSTSPRVVKPYPRPGAATASQPIEPIAEGATPSSSLAAWAGSVYRFRMPLPYNSENFAFHLDRARTQVNVASSQQATDRAITLASAQVHATIALALAQWLTAPTEPRSR